MLPYPKTIEEVFGNIKDLGAVLGLEARAQALVDDVHSEIQAQRTSHSNAPRVLLVLDAVSVGVIEPGQVLDELLTLAGGRNAVTQAHTGYIELGLEGARALEPDIAILLNQDDAALLSRQLACPVVTVDAPYVLLPDLHIPETVTALKEALAVIGGAP